MSEPEPWFFEGLGRVVVLVARLELQVAEIVALFEKATYERVNTLAANWRRTLDAFDAAVRELAPGVLRSELTALRDDVESVREERNRLAHSVAVVDIQAEWNPERTWFHYHPRTDAMLPLPTQPELLALQRRIGGLNGRALKVSQHVAEYVRSSEALS